MRSPFKFNLLDIVSGFLDTLSSFLDVWFAVISGCWFWVTWLLDDLSEWWSPSWLLGNSLVCLWFVGGNGLSRKSIGFGLEIISCAQGDVTVNWLLVIVLWCGSFTVSGWSNYSPLVVGWKVLIALSRVLRSWLGEQRIIIPPWLKNITLLSWKLLWQVLTSVLVPHVYKRQNLHDWNLFQTILVYDAKHDVSVHLIPFQ